MDVDERPSHDLVGGPFAVIESDPGVFTTLVRTLGVRGVELAEIYDIEPWAVDHIRPHGLIFCYMCTDDSSLPDTSGDGLDDGDEDTAAKKVWFANQLSDDACAAQAILNVLLNCPVFDIGPELHDFHASTEEMSAVMKGLAISNSHFIRQAQNSLARPADIRGGLNAIASTTLSAEKAKEKARKAASAPPPAKKRKTGSPAKPRRKPAATESSSGTSQEAYHFIGYVPAHGRVWELDGLRPQPVEVGTLPAGAEHAWMDVVRPALRLRMQRHAASGAEEHIRYNLLALVDDPYLQASDALEMLKRERGALERRLSEAYPHGWADRVDQTLLASAEETFTTSLRPPMDGRVYSTDFGARKMDREIAILDMPGRALPGAWEACVRAALPAKISVEDEVAKARDAHTEHISRTFDYEPFITAFVESMHNEGLLDRALSKKQQANEPEAQTPKTPAKKGTRAKTKR